MTSAAVDSGLNILDDMQASSGSPRDLTHSQINMLRAAFEDQDVGIYLMATQIFGYTDLIPSLHLPISRFMGKWGHSETTISGHIWTPPNESDGEVIDSDRRLMVCIPRECFKTSMCTRVGALWTLARNHDATIGLFNEKEENAQSWVGAICEVVESSWLFQILWRDMIPQGIGYWDKEKGINRKRSLKWGAAGVLFDRGALGIPELSIEPRGIGGAVTGKHYTHKILDDIIGEKAATSQAIMADAISWIDHSRPLERPAENGCELVVHTPWAYADVYCWGQESRVTMADGSYKDIERVVAGDMVMGFKQVEKANQPTKTGRGYSKTKTVLTPTRVLAAGRGIGKVVNHKLSDGTWFRTTPEHKFWKWCRNKRESSGYAEVQNLKNLNKVHDPVGNCPDPIAASWLGGCYDADGSHQRNTISIYQSRKACPEVANRIAEYLNRIGIAYKEYTITEPDGRYKLTHFNIHGRENRAKFLLWCNPIKHRDRIIESLYANNQFHKVTIEERADPYEADIYWIETETGNYICEGLASKNSHMLKKWSGEYKVHKRHLLEDEDGNPSLLGKSIFPNKISTSKALQIHKAEPFVFYSQYMCVPRAGKKMDFSDEWFHFGTITYSGQEPVFAIDQEHYNPEVCDLEVQGEGEPPRLVALNWMEKAILFDPIPGKLDPKEPNCKHGLAAVGVDPWGRRIMFESVRSDAIEMDICEEVLNLARKWGAAKIGVEEVNFSWLYQPLIKLVADQKFDGWCPQIVGCMTGGRQKDQRIREDLAPVHQRHFWYYNRVGTAEAIEELTEFPHSTFKDVSDAQAYTDQVLSRPNTPNEDVQSYYREQRQSDERGPTGYGF